MTHHPARVHGQFGPSQHQVLLGRIVRPLLGGQIDSGTHAPERAVLDGGAKHRGSDGRREQLLAGSRLLRQCPGTGNLHALALWPAATGVRHRVARAVDNETYGSSAFPQMASVEAGAPTARLGLVIDALRYVDILLVTRVDDESQAILDAVPGLRS